MNTPKRYRILQQKNKRLEKENAALSEKVSVHEAVVQIVRTRLQEIECLLFEAYNASIK